MTFEFIDLEVRGPVGWYRFNRPPRNSVDWDMLYEMTPAFEALLDRDEVKVVAIGSAVDGYFGTGADVSESV